MPSYLNALHEAMSLIGGDVSWFSVPEYISALVAFGLVFIVNADISTMLRQSQFGNLADQENVWGFYRKVHKGSPYLQVRRLGEPPHLLTWPPSSDGIARVWTRRPSSMLPDDLVKRVRTLPFITRRLGSTAAPGGAAADGGAVRASARCAPLTLPPWVVASLATHGGWTAVVGTTAARYKRRGANDGRPIVEVNVEATAAAGLVSIAAKVFGHEWAVCDSGQVNESGLRRVLRVLGERSLCPGVGEGDVSPAARPGYSAVARHAVRNGAAELIARPASSFVIGARTGGVLENTEGELPGVAPGPRFRADDCALVDEPSAWTARRGGNASYCEPCARFLRSLISAATSEHEKASATAAGHAPSEFTNHAHISHDSPSRVTLALVAGASRTAAANQRHRRTRAAVRAQVDDSTFSPPTCEASTKMVSAFEGLEKSEGFARCFEEGSVQR